MKFWKGQVLCMAKIKKRVKDSLLTYVIFGVIILSMIALALVNVNVRIKEYGRLRENGINERKNAAHALANDSNLPSQEKMEEIEIKPLSPRELMQKKAGIPLDKEINWNLVESIGSIVEHEVGYNESYYPYYDFDYLQQLMAKSVVNRLRSSAFPDDLYRVVNQEGQYPGVWEYICNNHHRVKENTQVNVIKALYKCDYTIPADIFFEHSFALDTNLEEATDIGEDTPAVGNLDQAIEWLYEQPISSELYAFDSFIYWESDEVQRLVIFSGSPSGPY